MFSIQPLDYSKSVDFTEVNIGNKKGKAIDANPLSPSPPPINSIKTSSPSFQRQVELSQGLARSSDLGLLAKEGTATQKKLWNAAKGLETILINQMFKSMQSTLEGDKLIGENSGTKIFKDFLNSERSKIVGENSDFGVARAIYKANVKYL